MIVESGECIKFYLIFRIDNLESNITITIFYRQFQNMKIYQHHRIQRAVRSCDNSASLLSGLLGRGPGGVRDDDDRTSEAD